MESSNHTAIDDESVVLDLWRELIFFVKINGEDIGIMLKAGSQAGLDFLIIGCEVFSSRANSSKSMLEKA